MYRDKGKLDFTCLHESRHSLPLTMQSVSGKVNAVNNGYLASSIVTSTISAHCRLLSLPLRPQRIIRSAIVAALNRSGLDSYLKLCSSSRHLIEDHDSCDRQQFSQSLNPNPGLFDNFDV